MTYGRDNWQVSATITHTECPGFVERIDYLDQMSSNGLYREAFELVRSWLKATVWL